MNELLVNRENRVLTLTLNRPEKRNALSTALCAELVERFEEADGDPGIGAVLLEAGGSVFCAGMDLDEALNAEAAEHTEIHERLFTVAAWIRKPIVACVQGPALGGGVGLAANAHVVVAAQGTSFALTEIRIGMWPFVIYRAMVTAIGERRTLALSLTGRVFSVQEALQWGLVHEIAPAIEVEDRAVEIASSLSNASPEVIRRGLEFVNRSRDMAFDKAGELGMQLRAEVFASADFREGVKAFREKRAPQWPSLKGS